MQYQPYQSTWTSPYGPQVQQPQFSPVVPSVTSMYPQPVNGIIKVNGRDSALQYQLPPNSMSPALFDKDGACFYVVSTDGTGTKTVETFDFMPHVDTPATTDDGYVSRHEFDELVARIDAMVGAKHGTDGPVQAEPETGDRPVAPHHLSS